MSKRGGGKANDVLSKAAVRRLCAAMEDFGAPPNVIDEDALMIPEVVTQFGQPPYRIDLLNAIDGVGFAKVWFHPPIRIRGCLQLVL